jgi:ribulose-5-phosphate 4-epimerase/fuculose-1-phosphate aldolase
VLLARHGVLGVGASAEAALDVCSLVERHAHIAWLLRLGG